MNDGSVLHGKLKINGFDGNDDLDQVLFLALLEKGISRNNLSFVNFKQSNVTFHKHIFVDRNRSVNFIWRWEKRFCWNFWQLKNV